MAKILYVDIKHPYSSLSEDQQVEDHLLVKPCSTTGSRGIWKWKYSKAVPVADLKSKKTGAPVADPKS